MERGLILLVAALMVYVAPGVHGTGHLSFANGTEVEVNRTGCGMTKRCLATPDDCDPSGNGTCLFASVEASTPMPPNGFTASVGLRGNSEGYIAMGLTANASEGITKLFICAQNSSNNGSFFFRTMDLNNTNGEFTPNERITREIRGTVNNSIIRCEFELPSVNATQSRTSHASTFVVLLGTGSFENNMLGAFNVSLRSDPINIAEPRDPTTTMMPITTPMTPAMTTGAGSAIHPHALLLVLGIIAMFVA